VRILSFGAAGFIGSHLTHRLLSEGHTVVAVDKYKDKVGEFLDHKNLIFVQQDITQHDWDCESLVKGSDLVIDLVAYANPALYVQIPLEVFQLNFTENLKIAELCVRHGKRLIQFSTCEVYGRTIVSFDGLARCYQDDKRFAVFSEDTSPFVLGPVGKHRWIYACAKQLLERVIHAYGLEAGLNYTIIRPFNFIGPKIDFLPSQEDGVPRVFSFFMDALLNGTEMKLVNGGHQRRSYTYIEDAVEGIYRIVKNPGGVCDREIFNIGSADNELTIRELAETMRDIYAAKFRNPAVPLPRLVEVSGEEFYGGWKAHWGIRELLEESMRYYADGRPQELEKERVSISKMNILLGSAMGVRNGD
jgi:UDP-apiose/xylose synthase